MSERGNHYKIIDNSGECAIHDEQFHTSLYDNCDSFNFYIMNYPFVDQFNLSETPAYGVCTSHFICILLEHVTTTCVRELQGF